MVIAATIHTMLVQIDLTETSWMWSWLFFFAVATIFARSVAIGAVLGTRATRAESVKLQHEEKAVTAERDEEASVKKDARKNRSKPRENK